MESIQMQPENLQFKTDIQQHFMFNMPADRKQKLMQRWFSTSSKAHTKEDIETKLKNAQERRNKALSDMKPSPTKHLETMIRAIDNKTDGPNHQGKKEKLEAKMKAAEERYQLQLEAKKLKAVNEIKKV